MVDISKLKFGSKINYKGQKYMVVDVLKTKIKARKLFDFSRDTPYGKVSNVITSISKKDLK